MNARAVIGFRNWKGTFSHRNIIWFMNFAPVMGKESFNEMSKDVAESYSQVAKRSMLEAANELHSIDENLCNIGVSCDGTSQKREFSSLLGAVNVISGHW